MLQKELNFNVDPSLNIKIEDGSISDIPQIVKLMKQTFGEFPNLEDLFSKWICENQYSVKVAKACDEVVGVCTWSFKQNNDYSKYECFGKAAMDFLSQNKLVWTVNLTVAPEFRRKNIGLKLSLAQLEQIKDQNYSALVGTSWVNGSDNNSMHLFEKFGFTKLGESRDFLRQQLPVGADCSVCKTQDCTCNSILYGLRLIF